MRVFGIIGIIVGAIAILDASFQIFARVIVQGHEVQQSSGAARTALRVVEALIGAGFIIMGIVLIVRAH